MRIDDQLTAAERAVLDAIQAASSWRGIDSPRGSRKARMVLDAVRPHLYREAAARLRDVCDRNGHGGDCCLTCDRGTDVDLLESLAGEMDQARAAGLEGRGDDH